MASSTFPTDQPIEQPKRNIRFRARSSAQQVQERSQRLYTVNLKVKQQEP